MAVERRLRERIKALEEQKKKLEEERSKFRDHFANRFRWWIKLLGEGKTPSLPWVIEDDAKMMNSVTWWYW